MMQNNRYNIKNETQIHTINFRGQDFHKLRDTCFAQRILFEDPYFRINRQYQWKRPFDICDEPKMFVDGASRFDVMQGSLGDCWLLAGMSALAMNFDLVRRVIPDDQTFYQQYAGIFHFRLWQFGKWYDVVIDDRLPVDKDGNLAFLRSRDKNEFWAPFLEKAYCKLVGGFYKVSEAGNMCEGLEDFSGGVVEQFQVKRAPKNFDQILLKSFMRKSLMGCFMDASPEEVELRRPDGLMKGHSYSITSVIALTMGDTNLVLIRIRNPWGQVEFTGPWSDNSPEWRNIPDDIKREIGLVYADDGEFWMAYSYFMDTWDWVDMCHMSPDVFDHTEDKKLDWFRNDIKGSWVKGLTDGGKRRMHLNPQVKLVLTEADDGDSDGYCSVLVALLQRVKGPDRFAYNNIGVMVYEIKDPQYMISGPDQYYFSRHKPVAKTIVRGVREVAGRFSLSPGTYCLVPYTYDSGKEGEYLLRVFTERPNEMEHLDYQIGLKPTDVRMSDVETKEDEEHSEADREEKDAKLKDFFDSITGGDMEADWRDLRLILEYAVSTETSVASDKSHFIYDIARYFSNFFSGSKRVVNAFETIDPEGFPKDLCRSMLALLDLDHSGKLNYQEFQDLWTGVLKWKSIYEIHSKETGGILRSDALKEALDSAGFSLNKKVLSDVVHRYANKDGNIMFDDFLHCGLKLTAMSNYFKSKEKEENKEIAEFSLEEFIAKTLYS